MDDKTEVEEALDQLNESKRKVENFLDQMTHAFAPLETPRLRAVRAYGVAVAEAKLRRADEALRLLEPFLHHLSKDVIVKVLNGDVCPKKLRLIIELQKVLNGTINSEQIEQILELIELERSIPFIQAY